jgi:hypothetical protein
LTQSDEIVWTRRNRVATSFADFDSALEGYGTPCAFRGANNENYWAWNRPSSSEAENHER